MRTAHLQIGLRARGAILLCGCLALGTAWAQKTPSPHDTPAPDHAAIAQVLENYRKAVSTGDEALFSTTLLDDQIPFFGLGDAQPTPASLTSAGIREVAGFRKSVFNSGRRYTQRFDDIRIVQDGALAQATLHFVTQRGDGDGGEGWKTLTLIDVGGQWKIASEFYTVRDLGDAKTSAPAAAKP